MSERAYVAMSGGVDSSVCLYLMRKEGYDCTGVTYRLLDGEAPIRQAELAKSVCDANGVPHLVLDLRAEFDSAVCSYFTKEYEAGRTPNPCVECNRRIKFEYLPKDGVIATGHYARVGYDENNGRYYLRRAKDESKDQTYFLYSLSQDILKRVRFPLGEYTKDEIRNIAAGEGYASAKAKDSQDICFIPGGDHAAYINERTGKVYPEGDFVMADGTVLGRHKGIIRYTIGQRKGLGLALPESMYVAAIDTESNKVILGRNEELFYRRIVADDVNFVSEASIEGELRCKAKIRYAHKAQDATVSMKDGKLVCIFDEPQRAPTLGQALVVYTDDRVICGGTINEYGFA